MFHYIVRRIVYTIPTLLLISIICFAVIQLPPGDFLTTYVAQLSSTGDVVDQEMIEVMRQRFGLDKPLTVQYIMWMKGVLTGDFGLSFEWNRPVSELIWERLTLTLVVSISTLFFIYALAIPIGIYSATHQYSIGDYVATFLGFIGLATPNFLLALVLMWVFYSTFGLNVGGLFSPEFIEAPWSVAKIFDLLNHLWIPILVLGTAGTCGLIRVMRGCLLDELRKQYVVTARTKGVSEARLLFKYPVRVSLIPVVSMIGWQLPRLLSGAAITSVVLGLPTTGPLLLRALMGQDMYLAGSFLLILATLTVIGTLVSDILLVVVDPRISFEKRGA